MVSAWLMVDAGLPRAARGAGRARRSARLVGAGQRPAGGGHPDQRLHRHARHDDDHRRPAVRGERHRTPTRATRPGCGGSGRRPCSACRSSSCSRCWSRSWSRCFFARTVPGRQLLASGGNPFAARLSGISNDRSLVRRAHALRPAGRRRRGDRGGRRPARSTPRIGDDLLLPSFAAPIIGGVGAGRRHGQRARHRARRVPGARWSTCTPGASSSINRALGRPDRRRGRPRRGAARHRSAHEAARGGRPDDRRARPRSWSRPSPGYAPWTAPP